MMKMWRIILFVVLVFCKTVPAQGLFKVTSFHGLSGVESRYQTQKTIFVDQRRNSYNSSLIIGHFKLNTSLVVWHPRFLTLEFGGSYNPGIRRDRFIVAPDRSEINSLEGLKGKAQFFANTPINLVFLTDFSHNYINRELSTNIESYKNIYGINFALRNRILPFNLQWHWDNLRQREFATQRRYHFKTNYLTGEANKSFTRYDQSQFRFNYRKVDYSYQQNQRYLYTINELQFNETIYFDKSRTNRLNSIAWYSKQSGAQEYQRFNFLQDFNYRLPYQFEVQSSIRYLDNDYQNFSNRQKEFDAKLKHQLFKSLTSNLQYTYNQSDHSDYTERRSNLAGGVDYTKKIPGGVLKLNYQLEKRQTRRNGETLTLNIFQEEHQLDDNKIVLLDYPFVDLGSIMVFDADGNRLYEQNVDFLLIQHENYVEIRRIPGGAIEPGATVLINYRTTQNINYRYTLNNRNFGGSLSLFKNILQLYYHQNKLDYDQADVLNFLTLKVIDQRLLGFNFRFKYLEAGAEKEDYKSNIVPYKSVRYFLNFSGTIKRNLNYLMHSDFQRLNLTSEQQKQEFLTLSYRLLYTIFPRAQFEFSGALRKQVGAGINLWLLTSENSFVYNYGKTQFKIGLEYFNRDYEGEKITFANTFVRIEREF